MNTVIIGGGAAGSYAAVFSARKGDRVTIIEPNGRIGRKLGITGKGRCNITNSCDFETLMKNIAKNPSFLYSAFSRFDQTSCMEFFEELGVPLKTERGGRVFPVSDKAQDIVRALEKELGRLNVKLVPERAVEITAEENRVSGVRTDKGFYKADKVILATGGLSYPATGSRGDGYKIAESLGHTVTKLKPALIPLETKDPCTAAAGLSVKNVTLSLFDDKSGKKVYSELGEMTFEAYGIGGPLTLTASAVMERAEDYRAVVDFKPALDPEKLDRRLLREISGESERSSHNVRLAISPKKARTAQDVVRTLLPAQLVQPILKAAGIEGEKRAAELSKADRKALCGALKSYTIFVEGFRPISEAIVTDGGVSVREISPKNMESRLVGGLFFAGEIIDAAGFTGGFNLQIAYSTARAAAEG
ncbi:MAG: NAD(P)/FAD-dependent oxidoreductase [Ruminiclostridium sp.]|nr:NAD(P)/FAD-dependent oxidoreductase [Ruminiclostridium sp.]